MSKDIRQNPFRPVGSRAESKAQTTDHAFRAIVSADAKRRLYRDACMLVMPSFEEGFGLPVLEAMACGVPVVISDRGSLPEVAGEAATAIKPADTDALAEEMARLLAPPVAQAATTRGLARAAQFSWDRCAAAAREAYRTAIEQRRSRGR